MNNRNVEDVIEITFPGAKDVIFSDDFATYDMAEKYRRLQARSGIDFSASIVVLEKLPLFMNGGAHREMRKKMATQVAATKSAQMQAVKDTTDNLLTTFFTSNQTIELVEDIAEPLWQSVSRKIASFDGSVVDIANQLPDLFFPTISIRKRESINNRLAAILDDMGEEGILQIALITLGARPYTGSIALSLYDAIANNPSGRLADIDLGAGFKKSSLTYVDRIAKADVCIEAQQFSAGQRARCITQSSAYSEQQNFESLYGFGKHLCLGRPISQFTFDYLKEKLRQYDCLVKAESMTMKKNTSPFTMPLHANVSVKVA